MYAQSAMPRPYNMPSFSTNTSIWVTVSSFLFALFDHSFGYGDFGSFPVRDTGTKSHSI